MTNGRGNNHTSEQVDQKLLNLVGGSGDAIRAILGPTRRENGRILNIEDGVKQIRDSWVQFVGAQDPEALDIILKPNYLGMVEEGYNYHSKLYSDSDALIRFANAQKLYDRAIHDACALSGKRAGVKVPQNITDEQRDKTIGDLVFNIVGQPYKRG